MVLKATKISKQQVAVWKYKDSWSKSASGPFCTDLASAAAVSEAFNEVIPTAGRRGGAFAGSDR